MGQLIKIEPPSEEERRQRIEKLKRMHKMMMTREDYLNIFESDDDPYCRIERYHEPHKRKRWIKEFGYDPFANEAPLPHTPF